MQAKNEIGQTPLHEAANQGHSKIVQKLLEEGADARARDNVRLQAVFGAKSNACPPSVIVVLAPALIRQLQKLHTRKFQWSGAGAHVSTGAAVA